MSAVDINWLIVICLLMLEGILFVLFGQITVRRLRKDPQVKGKLGLEYVDGYDILNVSLALSLPRRLMRRGKQSRFPILYADVDALYEHTSRFDRVLARLQHWCLWITVTYALINVAIWGHSHS